MHPPPPRKGGLLPRSSRKGLPGGEDRLSDSSLHVRLTNPFSSLSLSPFLASTLLRVSRRTYRRSFSPLLPNEPYDSRTIIYTSTTNRSTIPCLTQDKVGSRTFVRIESTPLDREVFSKFRRMHYRCASSRKAKFHLGERGEGGR